MADEAVRLRQFLMLKAISAMMAPNAVINFGRKRVEIA